MRRGRKRHCYRPFPRASLTIKTVIPYFTEMGTLLLLDATEKVTWTPFLSVFCPAPRDPPMLQEGPLRLIPRAVQVLSGPTPQLRCPGTGPMPLVPLTIVSFAHLTVHHLTPSVSRLSCDAYPAPLSRRCPLLTGPVLDAVFTNSWKRNPALRKGTVQPRANTQYWRMLPRELLCRGGMRRQTPDPCTRKAAAAQPSFWSSQFGDSLM